MRNTRCQSIHREQRIGLFVTLIAVYVFFFTEQVLMLAKSLM